MEEDNVSEGRVTPSFEDLANEWLTNAEAAALLGVRPDTLRDYRAKGRSPRYHKRGHIVLYRRTEIEAHLRAGGRSHG